MISMTGYGRGEAELEGLSVTVELSSVNRKNLEVSCSLPRDWQGMERNLTDALKSRLRRGKVQVSVRAEAAGGSVMESWDDQEIELAVNRLRDLCAKLAVPFEPDAHLLVRLISSVATGSDLPDWETAWPQVFKAAGAALNGLVAMREAEGLALRNDLAERLGTLQRLVENIEAAAPDSVPHYREVLLQRLRQADLELDPNDERVLKEIAIFADRCDISEELTRLHSHLEQFAETIKESEPVGRKLDFLCQEMFRELNTIGSKANNVAVTQQVIEGKNELERIREQVQNVE